MLFLTAYFVTAVKTTKYLTEHFYNIIDYLTSVSYILLLKEYHKAPGGDCRADHAGHVRAHRVHQ